jgi:hypothetical protein
MNLSTSPANGLEASAKKGSVLYASASFRFFSFSTALRAGGAML